MATHSPPKKVKLEYYQGNGRRDQANGATRIEAQWYWRKVQANGRITSDGAEGYSKRANVIRACAKEAASLHPDTLVTIVEVKP